MPETRQQAFNEFLHSLAGSKGIDLTKLDKGDLVKFKERATKLYNEQKALDDNPGSSRDKEEDEMAPPPTIIYQQPHVENSLLFNGKDFEPWFRKICLRLKAMGLFHTLSEVEGERGTPDEQNRAMEILGLHVEHNTISLISGSTPYDFVQSMKDRWAQRTKAQICQMKTALAAIRLADFKKVEDYADSIRKQCNDLNEDESVWLSNGLPNDLRGNSLRGTITGALQKGSSADDIREIIVAAYKLSESSSTPAASASGSGPVVKSSAFQTVETKPSCHRCGRPGHFARSCYASQPVNSNNGNYVNFNRNPNGPRHSPNYRGRGNGGSGGQWRGGRGGRGSNGYRGGGQGSANGSGGERPDRRYCGGDITKTQCFNCAEYGHISVICPKLKETSKRPDLKSTAMMAVESNGAVCERSANESELVWVLDSGATNHFINDVRYFVESEETHELVTTAFEGQFVTVTRVGTVNLRLNGRSYHMYNVKYSCQFTSNLLSTERLRTVGWSINYAAEIDLYDPEGSFVVRAVRSELGLNEVRFNFVRDVVESAMTVSEEAKLWHRRLGHPSDKVLAQIKDLPSNSGLTMTNCDVCAKAKLCRNPCNETRNVVSRNLELIHTDVIGPLPPSVEGDLYVLNFLDDRSHFNVSYIMANRSEVGNCFDDYVKRAEAIQNLRIAFVRCDNAWEFIKGVFSRICNERGITLQRAEAFVHQHNGKVERYNRTLMDKTRTLLFEARMPQKYWCFAVEAANYLLNHLPSRVLSDGETPYTLWRGKKTTYEFVRVFGSQAKVFVHPEQRKKLDERIRRATFVVVGYTETGYKLLNIEDDTTDVFTHVRIDERTKYGDLVNWVVNEDRYIEEHECVPTESAMLATGDTELTFEEANSGPEREFWRVAMNEELSNLKRMNTYELVEEPAGVKVLGVRWVFRKKDAKTYKARLVVLGYQEGRVFEQFDVYSPVVRSDTIKALLALAIKYGWQIRHVDIKGAFLYGKLPYAVFVRVPKGFYYRGKLKNPVWRLLRALYGLRISPVTWYNELSRILKKIGLTATMFDATVFIFEGDSLRCVLAIYVDDLWITGWDNDLIAKVIDLLSKNFDIKDLGQVKKYLGVNFIRTEECCTIDQIDYIESLLTRFNLDDADTSPSPFEDFGFQKANVDLSLEFQVRSMIGSLLYVASWSRLDIAFAVNFLSRYQTKPSSKLIIACNRVLTYLKGTLNFRLRFAACEPKLLTAFVDADLAGYTADYKSTSGFILFLFGCPVVWRAKKQSCVAVSSGESEYVALSHSVCEIRAMRNLLYVLGFPLPPTLLLCDSTAAAGMAKTPETSKSRHIKLSYHNTRNAWSNREIDIVKVDGKINIADGFTKPLAGKKLVDCFHHLFDH